MSVFKTEREGTKRNLKKKLFLVFCSYALVIQYNRINLYTAVNQMGEGRHSGLS